MDLYSQTAVLHLYYPAGTGQKLIIIIKVSGPVLRRKELQDGGTGRADRSIDRPINQSINFYLKLGEHIKGKSLSSNGAKKQQKKKSGNN